MLTLDLNFAGNLKTSFFLHCICLLHSQLLSSVSASKDTLAAEALSDTHPSAISEIGSLMKSHALHSVRSQSEVTAVTQDVIAQSSHVYSTQSSLFSTHPSTKSSVAVGGKYTECRRYEAYWEGPDGILE